MKELEPAQPISLRDTAEGIAIRAGILTAAGLVLGAWVFSLVAKMASGLVKVLVGFLLLIIGAGLATWEVKKVQRRFAGRFDEE